MILLGTATEQFAGAWEFIVHGQRSRLGGIQVGGSHLLPLFWTHIAVSITALALAVILALPLGLWLGHMRRGSAIATMTANAGRAVPSLALIAFFIAYIGIGFTNVVFALTVLAIPPILANTVVGVQQIDQDVIDAAHGCGMGMVRTIIKVKVPLAGQTILTGIRTAAVTVVATATIAPLAGVMTLGDPIINANVYGDSGRLGGAMLVTLLAFATELSFVGLQRTAQQLRIARRQHQRLAFIATALASLLLLSGCNLRTSEHRVVKLVGVQAQPIKFNSANRSVHVTIGSKNFNEEFILAQIYTKALQAAGYRVSTALNLGSETIAFRALQLKQIDAYPEYIGTILTALYGKDPRTIPHNPKQAYAFSKRCLAQDSLVPLPITPFSSTQVVIMNEGLANKLGVRKISDLRGKSEQLLFSGPPECRTRTDCYLGIQRKYKLQFKRYIPVDTSLRHEVIKQKQADVGTSFITDGQTAGHNFRVLIDDRKLFPPYNISLVVNKRVLKQAGPNFAQVVENVQKNLSVEVLQELNSRVDLDKESPADVAQQYLREAGYVK